MVFFMVFPEVVSFAAPNLSALARRSALTRFSYYISLISLFRSVVSFLSLESFIIF